MTPDRRSIVNTMCRDRTHEHRIRTITAVIGIMVCLLMLLFVLARGDAQTDGEKLVELKTRTDAIDRHLVGTDANVGRIYDKLNELESRFSTMQGEEYGAWAMLGLLGVGNLVTLRKSKGDR